jgi:hypothetical protein
MTEQKAWRLADLLGDLAFQLVIQALFLLLTSIVLDGGILLRNCAVAVVTHWVTILYLCLRRRNKLTWGDTMLVRWGFFFYFAIALTLRSLSEFVIAFRAG